MPRRSIIAAVAVTSAIIGASAYWTPGYRVIDGDGIAHAFWRYRMADYDAPALRTWGWGKAKCAREAELGLRAKARLGELVSQARTIELKSAPGRDPYGRRLAILIIDGRNAADTLFAEGLAKPWRGRGQKPDWCQ